MFTSSLMQLFKFDETDLAANRQGRLTEKQLAHLAKAERRRKGWATFGGLGLLGIGFIGIPIALMFVFKMYATSPFSSLLFGGAFGCVWPLSWGGIGVVILRRAFVKLQVTVQKAEGPVNVIQSIRKSYDSETHTTSTYTVYELLVGGRAVVVPSRLKDLLTPGDEYAVYLADFQTVQTPEILSVEFLRKGDGTIPIPEPDDPEVVAFLQQGELLQAIKAYRARHQCSYEEGRAMVEAIQARMDF